ncbi:MAG TPA: hypothetical protein VIX73_16725 [Kofleriaceae bacterium]
MPSHHPHVATSRSRPRIAVVGGLVLGTTDLLFACTFAAINSRASPVRVFQSVARGVLGMASYNGGAASAVLGVVLHYVIAISMALVYYAASRRYPALALRPLLYGPPYGLLLYLIMNLVVLPLSAVGLPSFANTLWVSLSVVMHLVFGVICAVAARIASTQA